MTSDTHLTSGNGHAGDDDAVLPFAIEALDVRGRVVRLGPAIDTILRRHGYPDPVARLKGSSSHDAEGFQRFLLSPAGQAIFRRFGFTAAR